MKPIIEVHNVSKQYRLGKVGTGSLSHDVNRWWYRVRGKEDPYLKIGQVNDRTTKAESDYVWALRNIDFQVAYGDAMGIIGKNGAGKSTLLKILSRITNPTLGTIKMKGKVASLLEVGTGMHPELTGRENIYLNGAILGMRKKEIDGKLEAIVDFAGIQRYVDTPVKRYSSGMHVRLGFAVAAYLDPNILIVDEVLAVGDAEFQKKCLGKMEQVRSEEGRTVLFVSHNMEAMARLCQKVVYLRNGMVENIGPCPAIIEQYLSNEQNLASLLTYREYFPGSKVCKLLQTTILNNQQQNKGLFYIDEPIGIEMTIEVLRDTDDLLLGFNLYNYADVHILSSHATIQHGKKYAKGIHKSTVWIPANFLAEGMHKCSVAAMSYHPFTVHFHEWGNLGFTIAETMSGETVRGGQYTGHFPGLIRPQLDWQPLEKHH